MPLLYYPVFNSDWRFTAIKPLDRSQISIRKEKDSVPETKAVVIPEEKIATSYIFWG